MLRPMNAKPLLQDKWDKVLSDPNYAVQKKMKVERAIINTISRTTITTRAGHDISHLVPHIVELFSAYKYNNCIFDTELAIPKVDDALCCGMLNPHSKVPHPDHQLIKAYVFDYLVEGGWGSYEYTLKERYDSLEWNFLGQGIIILPMYPGLTKEAKLNFYQKILEEGGEGIMLKNLNSYYFPGKRPENVWYKLKGESTYDCFIIGYKEGKGKFSNLIGAIELGQYHEGNIISVGFAAGFSDRMRESISCRREQFLHKVVEIAAQPQYTKGNKLENPRFKRFRYDKTILECKKGE